MSSNGPDGATGPLKGVKVLDWTVWQFGPVSTSMMGDMGADVLKIEALDGDPGRALQRASTLNLDLPDDINVYFEACNRNKRSLAVNLKTPEGTEIVHKLVESADVFVQNFRKGVAERLGLGYETLREINPMLVYGSASGYGPEGPDAYLPSFDGNGQARSGLMMSAKPIGAREPTRITQGCVRPDRRHHAVSRRAGGDCGAGAAGSGAEGRGLPPKLQYVAPGTRHQHEPPCGRRWAVRRLRPGRARSNPLANMYECKDGRWIQFMHLQPDRYWKDFAAVLGIGELVDDARFATMHGRAENSAELVKILDRRFAARTFEEWERALREAGDFIYAKVQTIEELEDDPQVIANEYITAIDHPTAGAVKMCNHPNTYSDTPARIQSAAPRLGQHAEDVLIDELGYSWDDIQRLRDAGAIL